MLQRTMWELEKENRACCLFSAVSALTPKEAQSLHTLFHVSTSSISADRSERDYTDSSREFFCNEDFKIWNVVDLQASDIQD